MEQPEGGAGGGGGGMGGAPGSPLVERRANLAAAGLADYEGVRARVQKLKAQERRAVRAKRAARELELAQVEAERREFEQERRQHVQGAQDLQKRLRESNQRSALARERYEAEIRALRSKLEASIRKREKAVQDLKARSAAEAAEAAEAAAREAAGLRARLRDSEEARAAEHEDGRELLRKCEEGVTAECRARLAEMKERHARNLEEVLASEEDWRRRAEGLKQDAQQARGRADKFRAELREREDEVRDLQGVIQRMAEEGEQQSRNRALRQGEVAKDVKTQLAQLDAGWEKRCAVVRSELAHKASEVESLKESLRSTAETHSEEVGIFRGRWEAEIRDLDERYREEARRRREESAEAAERQENERKRSQRQVQKLTRALLDYKAVNKLQAEEIARFQAAQATNAIIDLKLGALQKGLGEREA